MYFMCGKKDLKIKIYTCLCNYSSQNMYTKASNKSLTLQCNRIKGLLISYQSVRTSVKQPAKKAQVICLIRHSV